MRREAVRECPFTQTLYYAKKLSSRARNEDPGGVCPECLPMEYSGLLPSAHSGAATFIE